MSGRRSNHEGSIYQSKDGRWIGELTMRARRRRVSGKSKREVSQRLRTLRTEMENERNPLHERLTVGHALSRLVDPKYKQTGSADRSITSTEALQWACDVWGGTSIRHIALEDVRAENVEQAYDQMTSSFGTRYSQRSMKQIRSVLLRSMRQELIRTGNQKIQVALTSAEAGGSPTSVTPPKTKRALPSRSREAHSRARRQAITGLSLVSRFFLDCDQAKLPV